MIPAFLGLSGPTLSDVERAFFRSVEPAGYILFRRNVSNRGQVKALTDELRALAGRDDLPILIDQEGGRVARLQPPEWPAFPTGEVFDRAYEKAPMTAMQAIYHNSRALGAMLSEVGVSVNCLPLLDVRQAGAHDIIGDRALGSDPMRVAALGRMVIDGLRDAGTVGVVKHVPGHGRALADSHLELPVVEASAAELENDIAPFRTLARAPMAMTAHVVYTAWDAEQCASLSPKVIGQVIRGAIGFDNLLMSDDLGMHALVGDFGERAAGVIAAGCDIALHCSGDMAEMEAIAGALTAVTPQTSERLERAMATVTDAPGADMAQAIAERDRLLAALS